MAEKLQNPAAHCIEKELDLFTFKKVKASIGKKSLNTETGYLLSVNTTQAANEHLPFPKNFQFESCLLSPPFERIAVKIRNFHVRNDDVWVLSYPKSGNTWVQNIVSQLKYGIDSKREPVTVTDAWYLEGDMVLDNSDEEVKRAVTSAFGNTMEKLDKESSPRIIKSHLPPNLLPVELWTVRPKIIYIARNPKDVAVSMYHMLCNDFKRFTGTIEEYFDLFLEDRNWYAPFHAHVTSFWQLRNEKDFMFLTYEELSADRLNGVKRISKFLECSYSEDELQSLADYVAFGNIKQFNTKEFLEKPKLDPKYR